MSHYHDRFKQHAFQNSLKALVESMEAASPQLTDLAQVDAYARFRRVVDLAKRTIGAIDPDLVGDNALNTLNEVLTRMKVQFDNFVSTKTWQVLNPPADELLDRLCRLPRLKFPRGQEAFAAALEDYRTQCRAMLSDIKQAADAVAQQHQQIGQTLQALKTKVHGFDQQFEAQKGRVDTLINQKQGEFNQGEQNRNTKFTEQQSQFQRAESERSQQFAQQQEQIQQQFKAVSGEIRKEARASLEEARSEFDGVRAEYEQKSSACVEQLRARLDEAVKLVGIIGNTGLTGNYQRIANEQRRIADRFRWIAIACMVLAMIFVGTVVFSIGKSTFSWEVALFRLAGALPFIIAFTYCARESTRHRAVEQRNRRIELELVSLSPYLAELTDQDRKKIIGELSAHYFGREGPHDEDDVLRKLKNIKGEDLLKLVERISKSVRPP